MSLCLCWCNLTQESAFSWVILPRTKAFHRIIPLLPRILHTFGRLLPIPRLCIQSTRSLWRAATQWFRLGLTAGFPGTWSIRIFSPQNLRGLWFSEYLVLILFCFYPILLADLAGNQFTGQLWARQTLLKFCCMLGNDLPHSISPPRNTTLPPPTQPHPNTS